MKRQSDHLKHTDEKNEFGFFPLLIFEYIKCSVTLWCEKLGYKWNPWAQQMLLKWCGKIMFLFFSRGAQKKHHFNRFAAAFLHTQLLQPHFCVWLLCVWAHASRTLNNLKCDYLERNAWQNDNNCYFWIIRPPKIGICSARNTSNYDKLSRSVHARVNVCVSRWRHYTMEAIVWKIAEQKKILGEKFSAISKV